MDSGTWSAVNVRLNSIDYRSEMAQITYLRQDHAIDALHSDTTLFHLSTEKSEIGNRIRVHGVTPPCHQKIGQAASDSS
jgi:hypothetical protein